MALFCAFKRSDCLFPSSFTLSSPLRVSEHAPPMVVSCRNFCARYQTNPFLSLLSALGSRFLLVESRLFQGRGGGGGQFVPLTPTGKLSVSPTVTVGQGFQVNWNVNNALLVTVKLAIVIKSNDQTIQSHNIDVKALSSTSGAETFSGINNPG